MHFPPALRTLVPAVSLIALFFAGCDGGSGDAGDNGGDWAPAAVAGVGDACGSGIPCRQGLVCGGSGTCELGRSLDVGGACVMNGDCKPGLQCDFAKKTCAPGGAGADGDPCKTDGECKDGYRCNLVGFATACAPEGTGDLGKPCVSSGECLGGLGCVAGKCASAPGVPPYGTAQSAGVDCAEESGPPIAHFRVPRGSDDGDYFRLPFPNDIRRKGGHPDYSGYPTPGAALLGFDPIQRYIDRMASDDGFSGMPTVLFRFSETPDSQSVAEHLRFVDISPDPEPGTQGWTMVLADSRGKYICRGWLGVRRNLGVPLRAGHTYAVLIEKGPKTKSGPVGRAPDFDAVMSDAAPGDPALTSAHAAYAPLRSWLKTQGKSPDDLLVAAVFTAAATTAPAEKLAKAVATGPIATAASWTKCGDGPSPCKDTSGSRACGGGDPAFDEYHALVTLPIFQQGTAPYAKPEDGGDIDVSGEAAAKVRDEEVCASLTVPKGQAPAGGFPVVLYAHGTGGSFRSHIIEGVAAMLAGAPTPMAVLGVDQVSHGPRRGTSTESPNNLFFNFTNPGAARGNPLQGAADQMSLSRLLAAGLGAPAALDPSRVLFWGHSQGATEGGIAMPYTPGVRGVVFSGQGGSLVDALLGKKRPVDIAAALPFALMDVEPGSLALYGGAFHPELAIMQAYIDPADPLNHAPLLVSRPVGAATPHHVFQVFGLDDSFSPPATEASYAIAAELALVSSDASKGDESKLDVFSPDAVPPPVSANLGQPDGKTFTAGVRKYAPASGKDGHFVAFDDALAREDVTRFLSEVASGTVPHVGK